MGKYLITMRSMDGEAEFDRTYAEGIECDGFCIMTKESDDSNDGAVAIHKMSIDGMSEIIKRSPHMMAAGILAKAKRDSAEIMHRGELDDKMRGIRELLGMG